MNSYTPLTLPICGIIISNSTNNHTIHISLHVIIITAFFYTFFWIICEVVKILLLNNTSENEVQCNYQNQVPSTSTIIKTRLFHLDKMLFSNLNIIYFPIMYCILIFSHPGFDGISYFVFWVP